MECKSLLGWQPFGTPTTLLYICLIIETCYVNAKKFFGTFDYHPSTCDNLQTSKKIHFSAVQ
jgi:hypothetical protein